MLAGIQKSGQAGTKPIREISTINGNINRCASNFGHKSEHSDNSSANFISGGTEEILERLNAA